MSKDPRLNEWFEDYWRRYIQKKNPELKLVPFNIPPELRGASKEVIEEWFEKEKKGLEKLFDKKR